MHLSSWSIAGMKRANCQSSGALSLAMHLFNLTLHRQRRFKRDSHGDSNEPPCSPLVITYGPAKFSEDWMESLLDDTVTNSRKYTIHGRRGGDR